MKVVNDFLRVVNDPEKLKRYISEHSFSIKVYSSFLLLVFIFYHLFSDGDFSFLLTLSSIISMFSFLMVFLKIEMSKSCAGVSLKMMECYVVLNTARLLSIVPFEGYLPYDKSGDWLYQLVEAISLFTNCCVVYLCRYKYKKTYDSANDIFNNMFLIIPAFVISIFIHPSLNSFFPADVSWSFALYLESVCVLPQLSMFQKEGKVAAFTTHFLASQALSKVLSFLFWIVSYKELNSSDNIIKSYVGVWVVIMQIVQLILMGDFIYHYIRCLSKGVSFDNLLNENV
ncbi:ER lumen protein retaining receptor 1, putative [Plasmodium chabaudi chabaudi]|uniref:ER lumen protein retaining receptor 1, putative n=2 Tax=Plasmodium chabaudi TaxID=5825 RepID=A0A077TRM2_PLACU|nr:ER lumen protein retaining receptor 1, putative [Plasmodium chabaudi chabaudi]SCM10789.1 ER lumen protein retaining receptor 1, putative [Plasmodium chabaudi adami]SCM05689.1 ER lumen protein retaining receptor 1, putative [Plasmodium chabaudi chabaudi]SCM08856.1 ER lumen protein retaining receptor 1, putative [Plasmodium chabaudi chabaudi]SCM12883.1 ER lumen protein retaining receptor 1, putative [Plasmodium chabaudi adami]VTZ70452.1 ER lumen protein retaining receptor 1, putative [Plasmod|eukprot:XP_016654684.1 ER lumen protein retaining receptor 1, putative [Plasmodium chabaudi chabaudi]